jgi:molybdopterin-guanine dinucleotide biosynthesis protein A
MPLDDPIPDVSGVILAGGRARRMGGGEKGLQPLRGRPLIEWVIERFSPQVGELFISTNGDAYRRYGLPVLQDDIKEEDGARAGPLAGIAAALGAAVHPLVATVPCDAPLLPADLVARLRAALLAESADVAVASVGGRAQPVFVLARRETLPYLAAYLKASGRKADAWYAPLKAVQVRFDDQPAAFANANTPEELRGMER